MYLIRVLISSLDCLCSLICDLCEFTLVLVLVLRDSVDKLVFTLFIHVHTATLVKTILTADRLAQLVEHRTAVREVAGSNLGQTNKHVLLLK